MSLAWKAKVLPLNYSRTVSAARVDAAPMLGNHFQLLKSIWHLPVCWWRRLDSNQCRRKPTDLQSAPFSHSGTPPEASLRLCHLFVTPRKTGYKFLPTDGFFAGLRQIGIGLREMTTAHEWNRRSQGRQRRGVVGHQDQKPPRTPSRFDQAFFGLGLSTPQHEHHRLGTLGNRLDQLIGQHLPTPTGVTGRLPLPPPDSTMSG